MSLARILVAPLLLFALALPAAAQRARFTDAGAEQLLRSAALLVDLRTPQDWHQEGVLPSALLLGPLPADELAAALAPHLRADRPIVLLCREGWRSAQMARALAPLLGRDVLSVNGGMTRLIAQGYAPELP